MVGPHEVRSFHQRTPLFDGKLKPILGIGNETPVLAGLDIGDRYVADLQSAQRLAVNLQARRTFPAPR